MHDNAKAQIEEQKPFQTSPVKQQQQQISPSALTRSLTFPKQTGRIVRNEPEEQTQDSAKGTARVRGLEQRLQNATANVRRLELQAEAKDREMEKMRGELERAREENHALGEKVRNMERKSGDVQENAEGMAARVKELEGENAALKMQAEERTAVAGETIKENERLKADIEKRKVKYKELKDSAVKLEQLVKEYEEQSKRSRKEVRGTKESQGILLDRIKDYEKKCATLAQAYQDVTKRMQQVFIQSQQTLQ